MENIFILKLALKNLLIHRLRMVLTILGIAIGISTIIFLISFAIGIEQIVTSEISAGNAKQLIDVGSDNLETKINNQSIEEIKKMEEVKDVQYIITVGGKIKVNDKKLDATINGTTDEYISWKGIKTVRGDTLESSKNSKVILINEKVLELLKTNEIINKEITIDIYLSQDITNKNNEEIKDQKYKVVGVLEGKSSPIVYIKNSDMQKLGAVNFSQAKVELKNDNSATIISTRKALEDLGYQTQYIGDTVRQIEDIFNIFKIILGSFGLIALTVASLGMLNTLTISLMERTKEISLLKILGIKNHDVTKLFFSEAIILGIIGGISGIIIGLLAQKLINWIFNIFAINNGADPVALFHSPFWLILGVFIFALLIAFITGLYPTKRAVKIDALEVIRFE